MIYFYYGTDTDKSRVKTHELIDSLQKKKPDASFFKIDSDNFSEERVREYIESQGLFSNKYIVFLDRLCEKKEIKESFLEVIKDISESENIFIVLEGKLDKATATKIEKKSEKYINFTLEEVPDKPVYNAFALADAFGRRDKKNAWMLYRKAIDEGEAPEALHGMIFWKVKILILSGYSAGWTRGDLQKTMNDLVVIYHESRRGKHELETAMESWLLSI